MNVVIGVLTVVTLVVVIWGAYSSNCGSVDRELNVVTVIVVIGGAHFSYCGSGDRGSFSVVRFI